jgi:hypothetical protein
LRPAAQLSFVATLWSGLVTSASNILVVAVIVGLVVFAATGSMRSTRQSVTTAPVDNYPAPSLVNVAAQPLHMGALRRVRPAVLD